MIDNQGDVRQEEIGTLILPVRGRGRGYGHEKGSGACRVTSRSSRRGELTAYRNNAALTVFVNANRAEPDATVAGRCGCSIKKSLYHDKDQFLPQGR